MVHRRAQGVVGSRVALAGILMAVARGGWLVLAPFAPAGLVGPGIVLYLRWLVRPV